MLTPNQLKIRAALEGYGLFASPGSTGIVDGQFGSTGKGVIAALLAELFHDRVNTVVTNAGPNSGHTFYHGHEKVVLKQLPTFSVKARMMGVRSIQTVLSGGAVIAPEILSHEITKHALGNVIVHPAAAIIDAVAKRQDEVAVAGIASTGQGVGPAIQHKLSRIPGSMAVAGEYYNMLENDISLNPPFDIFRWQFNPLHTVLLEVSQGFSLGINSGFWPHVTSRECTIMQAMADAGIPPNFHDKCIMSVRTFPIRVGNVGDASSGPAYPDQQETSWEALGVQPELTTVTQRVRRVFTWSRQQFREAVLANAPDIIFLNFCNYLKDGAAVAQFIEEYIYKDYYELTGHYPMVLAGHGPGTTDVELF